MSIQTIGSAITLTQAASLTSAYQAANPGAPIGNLFGINLINEILNQSSSVAGIRIYYGLTPGTPGLQLVLVGVDGNGNDIVPGVYGDRSQICPPMCSTANAINGL